MNRLVEGACAIHDRLTAFAAMLGAVGLICITTFYVFEVVTRYFFNSPTSWVSDFVSYLLCISIFLALPKVTQDKGHVAVTILVDVMPSRIADPLYSIISLIGFGCLSFAAWVSLKENIRQYDKGIDTLAIISIPQWWVSSFITFGLFMSALYLLRYVGPSNRVVSNSITGSAG